MANTYTKIYLQIVFSPFKRENVIPVKYSQELQKYTTGIIQNKKHKLLAIKYMPDHVHILIGYQPSQPLPDLVRDIMANTSRFINEQNWLPGKFRWQEGYGAFSYRRAEIPAIIQYIINQTNHNKRKTFSEEYYDMLKEFEIDFDDRYIFKPVNVDYSVPDGT